MMSFLKTFLYLTAVTSCLSVWSTGQNADRCQQRSVVVNALKYGVPIQGLTLKDFKAVYRGRPANILNLQPIEASPRVVILLDTSGSMGGDPHVLSRKFQIAKALIRELLSAAEPKTQFALTSFSSQIGETIDFSGGRPAIGRWLDAHPDRDLKLLKGTTALFDAILAALKQLEPAQPGDAVVVITDGENNKGRGSAGQITPHLLDSQLRLFALMLNDVGVTPAENYGPDELSTAVLASGGFVFAMSPAYYGNKDQKFVTFAGDALDAQLSNFYRLDVQFSENPTKPQPWKLEVVDAEGRRRKDLFVAYPSEVPPCMTQSTRR